MIKHLSIVRSISSQLRNQAINFINPALLTGPVLFFLLFSSSAFGTIKIALIDTGFCPLKSSTIKVYPPTDLTGSVKLDCKKPDFKSPRFHGQHVLLEFLKYAEGKKTKIEIHPLIVFNDRGNQKSDYWQKAIKWVGDKKIDVVLTASGFITTADELKTLPAELPGVWFIPSGRVAFGVKETSILFPQALAPKKNLFLIGDYYDGKMVLYDDGLLYKDKIDYYFPSGKGTFTGTSRAVAEAAATAIKLCPVLEMRSCLQKLSKEYVDGISRKKIKSY